MWLALLSFLYSLPLVGALLTGMWQVGRAAKLRRWDARAGAGLALLALSLTGRRWVRRLRPQMPADPHVLTPTRTGYALGAGNVHLEWEQFGPDGAPALLLSHGWSLTHDTWFYQKIGLSDTYRVVVWDMRGTDRSSPPDDRDYSLEANADDLAAVFRASGAGSHPHGCILAGHSVGAMILPLFAQRHPDLMPFVRGLALLGGTDLPLLLSMRGRAWLRPLQTLFWEPLVRLMGACPAPFEAYARLIHRLGAVHLALMYGLRVSGETRGQDDMVAYHCSHFSMRAAGLGALACFRMDTRALLPRLALPTLLLTGQCDPNMPPEVQRAMRDRLPQGELVLLPDCGHLDLLECYEAVNTHLRAFAARCLAGAAGTMP